MTADMQTEVATSRRIRRFTADDIPAVADLHRKAFDVAATMSTELLEAYEEYFLQVFLRRPFLRESAEPRVYESKDGAITGFVAVVPRRMSYEGRRVEASIVSQFIVDPASRGRAALELLRSVFAGQQDIVIADEANLPCRSVWEALGGVTSHLYSFTWFYPLRPCGFGALAARKAKVIPTWVASVVEPFAASLDALGGRLLRRSSSQERNALHGEALTADDLAACAFDRASQSGIRTDYRPDELQWLIDSAARLTRNGTLQKVLVKRSTHEVIGAYVYYLNPGGISQVIALCAREADASDVLNHLISHAYDRGATALSGRMEPNFMQAFSEKHCILHAGPEWFLLHSSRPELVNAFNAGEAGFSRIDGEWCLHFR